MTRTQRLALENFFGAIQLLRDQEIIRGHKYLGDIAEFLCQDRYGVELARAGNQVGHDGHLDGQLVQVKYHGGSSTTVSCGDPGAYNTLIIVLGPDSVIRPAEYGDHPYLFLVIPSNIVMQNPPNNDGARTYTAAQLPLEFLDLEDED